MTQGYTSSRARGRSPAIEGMLAGSTDTSGTLDAWFAGVNFLQMIDRKWGSGTCKDEAAREAHGCTALPGLRQARPKS